MRRPAGRDVRDGRSQALKSQTKPLVSRVRALTQGSLIELLQDPDPEKSKRVMQAMLQMGKIDIAALQHAAAR